MRHIITRYLSGIVACLGKLSFRRRLKSGQWLKWLSMKGMAMTQCSQPRFYAPHKEKGKVVTLDVKTAQELHRRGIMVLACIDGGKNENKPELET